MTSPCTCPTCGQALPTTKVPVSALLALSYGRVTLSIIEALVRVYPRGIRTEALMDIAWADDPNGGPENARNTLYTTLQHIRKKLKPFGWTIDRPGIGKREGVYRLAPLEG